METNDVETLDDTCGVILSPRFPGLVEPGLWTWQVDGLDNFYFRINLHYVKGPAVEGCEQYFQSKCPKTIIQVHSCAIFLSNHN